jgi:predicted NAD-dependent protein-ADP-ribosyltransferase YbiA (DUF1768 family)
MSPARAADLVRREEAGTLPELLLFWGHRPPNGGGVGPGCLSQWYPAPFTLDGVRYATAEHHMMAARARLFGDGEAERLVLSSDDPGKAKGAGRRVRGYDEDTWAAHRYDIVVAANASGRTGRWRTSCAPPASESSSRRARTTRSGASGCPPPSRRRDARPNGAA